MNQYIDMNILIFEEEAESGKQLSHLIKTLRPQYSISAVLPSVAAGIDYFRKNPTPDLAFMNIRLADDSCFRFFERTTHTFPVIFTTTYDPCALRAFKVNSIDHLIKPIDRRELETCIKRIEKQAHNESYLEQIVDFAEHLVQKQNQRFSARVGDQLVFVKPREIAYICSSESSTWAVRSSGSKIPLDYSLDQLEKLLDPSDFFRVNQKYIVHLDAIQKIESCSGNGFALTIVPEGNNPVIVSKEKASHFTVWLDEN